MNSSRLSMVFSVALLSVVGCANGSPVSGTAGGGVGGTTGSAGGGDSSGTTGAPTGSVTGATVASVGTTAHTATSTHATTAGVTAATTTTGGSTSSGSTDPAQICVDTINSYRATRGLAAYGRWSSNESCVAQEAQTDGTKMVAHYAFANGQNCGSYAQDECPGYSTDPLGAPGIKDCLAQMWGEKDKPECSGCDACDFPYQGCTNCTFSSCGHFLNMKSAHFSEVACGFWSGGWYAQNFQ